MNHPQNQQVTAQQQHTRGQAQQNMQGKMPQGGHNQRQPQFPAQNPNA